MKVAKSTLLIAFAFLAAAVRGASVSDPESAPSGGGGVRGTRDLSGQSGQQGNGNARGKYVATNGTKVEGSYIIMYDDAVPFSEVPGKAKAALAKVGGKIKKNGIYGVINGFAADMTQEEAMALASEPGIKIVEEDAVVTTLTTWGLDRVDQRSLPLDNAYTTSAYPKQGLGATVFIIDTGILPTHEQWSGRASADFDSVGDGGIDCNGHGSHCAGTAVGKDYGVAPQAQLVGVRVLSCSGSGTWAGVIAGVDYVKSDCEPDGISLSRGGRCVASMSLGGGFSSGMNTAVANLRAAGVPVAVAAGNDNRDAKDYSPASEPSAFTVGSTTSSDARSGFSNYGEKVDIFAPGSSITSAWYTSNSATNTISGTSMATPHVAGALALVLGENQGLTASQAENKLLNDATSGAISSVGSGSPNKLLYVGDSVAPQPNPPVAPSPTPPPPAPVCDGLERIPCKSTDGCKWRGSCGQA